MTLTKDGIGEIIKNKSQISIQEARNVVELIIESIKGKLEQGEDVKISGFGKWSVRSKKSRPGRNPHTGERIDITPRRIVVFQPSDKFRDNVNKAHIDESKLIIVGRGDDTGEVA